MLKIPALNESGFALLPVEDSATPYFKFTGNGDTEAVAPLGRFLDLVHEDMRNGAHEHVAVDLTELYFMNSSCIKGFVSWIYAVKTCGLPYSITLQMNPRLQWQARTFATLQRLAPEIVSIQEISTGMPRAAAH